MKLRILLIEDEESIRETLFWHLTELGHDVACFNSIEGCPMLDSPQCKHEAPCVDMMIIDKTSRGETGYSFIDNLLKKNCRIPPERMAITTGFKTQEDVKRIKDIGCELLEKPLTFEKVERFIGEMEKKISPKRELPKKCFS